MQFLVLELTEVRRWSQELRNYISQLKVRNQGPAVAEDVEVTARWPPGDLPTFTVTLRVGRLEPGDAHTGDLSMRVPGDTSMMEMSVRWRDEGGAQERTELLTPHASGDLPTPRR